MGHAGVKASRQRPSDGLQPLGTEDTEKGEPPWQPVGPVTATHVQGYHPPHELTTNDIHELIDKFGYIEVHPYNDYEVIKGQGTIYLEMLKQISELDFLLVPVGGGGLLAGCSIIKNLLSKKTKLIGVESKFYPSLYNKLYIYTDRVSWNCKIALFKR